MFAMRQKFSFDGGFEVFYNREEYKGAAHKNSEFWLWKTSHGVHNYYVPTQVSPLHLHHREQDGKKNSLINGQATACIMTHVHHVESFRYIGLTHIPSNTDEAYLDLARSRLQLSRLDSGGARQADNLAVLLLLEQCRVCRRTPRVLHALKPPCANRDHLLLLYSLLALFLPFSLTLTVDATVTCNRSAAAVLPRSVSISTLL